MFTVVATVGIAAVLLGVFGLYDAISTPFPRIVSTDATNQDGDFSTLRTSDTDGDGLSDYDEIFEYRTSVFVKDSDSDGANDFQEVEKSTDPNCPTNEACGAIVTNTNSGSGTTAIALRDSLRKAGVPSTILDSTDDAALLKTYQEVLGGTNGTGTATESDLRSLNATQVRALLKTSGLDETTLNAVDDTTLLQIYRDAIGTD